MDDSPSLLDQLRAWLQTPTGTRQGAYAAGVALYAQLPQHSTFLRSLLERGPDEFNRRKLHELLSEALAGLEVQHQVEVSAYPPDLTAELAEGRQLMDLRVALKERLRMLIGRDDAQAVAERRAGALRILDIGTRLSQIYGRKLFWDQHRYFPEALDDKPAPADPTTRRNTLRTYVSRLKKEMAQADISLAQYERKAQLLAQYGAELRQLNATLPS